MKNCTCVVLIVSVVIIVGTVCGIPTTSSNVIVRHCEEDGGYCQNSWDCCSNRCLSFSYKCVKGSPSSSSVVSITALNPQHITVDTLEELINRFGGGDDGETLATPTTIETTTATSTSTSSIINNNPNQSECIGIGYECADSSQCCSNDCLHYLNVNICIQNRNQTVTNPQPECLTIGNKCYRNEECCTRRCHGYLHQCVT